MIFINPSFRYLQISIGMEQNALQLIYKSSRVLRYIYIPYVLSQIIFFPDHVNPLVDIDHLLLFFFFFFFFLVIQWSQPNMLGIFLYLTGESSCSFHNWISSLSSSPSWNTFSYCVSRTITDNTMDADFSTYINILYIPLISSGCLYLLGIWIKFNSRIQCPSSLAKR